ncbi:hypothetical protein [Anaeromyxobacter oryzisoli]|uniref:hypothetical protein n=1 Tax=Anaeromyxobacter oryzisoli TaxID=2925408 RepID=UPI001F583EEF|nr:hypothetical protein [Anaeromyxobacter sp. SG63]
MRPRAALSLHLALVASTLAALAAPAPASAIPAFARKYGTSCLTCHSVYPRLVPFGEAFRRNGYRFPGVDSDYVKQETVALGQEANKKTFPNSVWPATIPISIPLAFGANGQAFIYPDQSASVSRANNGTQYVLDDLVKEGHIWAGAALDDSVTLWGELTFGGGEADVEHAQVLVNDLAGPKHLLNVYVGRGFPTLGSFGPHSSYLGDLRMTTVPLTGIYGLSTDPFTLVDSFNGVEATGVLLGRLDWSAGVTAGKNVSSIKFNSENWYAHVGAKLGGMSLDGEGSQGPKDALRPWAEDAVTFDAFVLHSREAFPTPGVATAPPPLGDTSLAIGGAIRGQLGSLELDVGGYNQKHDRGTAGLASVSADVEWAELSYVVFPWLVPAVRVERIGLRPSDGPHVDALHVMPGIAFLLRANVKAVLVANIETTNGFPGDSTGAPLGWMGGNADWGGFAIAPRDTSTTTSPRTEIQSLALFLAWAI